MGALSVSACCCLALQWSLGAAAGAGHHQRVGPRQRLIAWRKSLKPDAAEVAVPSLLQDGAATRSRQPSSQEEFLEFCGSLTYDERQKYEAKIRKTLGEQRVIVEEELREQVGPSKIGDCSAHEQAVKDVWLEFLFDKLRGESQTISFDIWSGAVWDPDPDMFWSLLTGDNQDAITKEQFVQMWPGVVEELMTREKLLKLSAISQYMLEVSFFEVMLFNAFKGKDATLHSKPPGISYQRAGHKFVPSDGEGKGSDCFKLLYYQHLHGKHGMSPSTMHDYFVNYAGAFCKGIDSNHKLVARSSV